MGLTDTNYFFRCEFCRHHRNGGCDTWCDHGESYCPDMKAIPIINPAELRPKGRWDFRQNKKYSWCTDLVCTACETIIDSHCDNGLEYKQELIKKELLYCPHCGAKMGDQ